MTYEIALLHKRVPVYGVIELVIVVPTELRNIPEVSYRATATRYMTHLEVELFFRDDLRHVGVESNLQRRRGEQLGRGISFPIGHSLSPW